MRIWSKTQTKRQCMSIRLGTPLLLCCKLHFPMFTCQCVLHNAAFKGNMYIDTIMISTKVKNHALGEGRLQTITYSYFIVIMITQL